MTEDLLYEMWLASEPETDDLPDYWHDGDHDDWRVR